ncbi:unnamed protein product [Dovyalis caffra]|uniref:Uncharacterized protein n=1 Tax=Dovyalis caffra TaxID=77055 RepID=A0AAV1R5K9_9ROSI|nr:unnamed protein product [Dovyalis caffra]
MWKSNETRYQKGANQDDKHHHKCSDPGTIAKAKKKKHAGSSTVRNSTCIASLERATGLQYVLVSVVESIEWLKKPS